MIDRGTGIALDVGDEKLKDTCVEMLDWIASSGLPT